MFPDAYERYIAPIPEEERGDLMSAFHKRLTSTNPVERSEAARAWAHWEGETLSLRGAGRKPPRFEESRFVDAFARIENHYFVNNGFFDEDGWILKNAHILANIPGVIVHGRYDVVTPLTTAWSLKKAWPRAEMHIIPDAGHSSLEPGIVDKLIRATRKFSRELV